MPKQAINMSVESAQIWAINIAVNGDAIVEIETDRFRSILTTSVVSAQIWAINIAVNGNAHV